MERNDAILPLKRKDIVFLDDSFEKKKKSVEITDSSPIDPEKLKEENRKKREEIDRQRANLPISSAQLQLIEKIRINDSVVIVGETGSGKTTQIPQYLKAAGFTRTGAIGVTQPRRVAALTISQRVADEQDVELGKEVGYSIRFDDKSCPETQIKYLTDGMLLREAIYDPFLSNYSVIILDEAHERTIHTDILFGVLKGVQKRRKEKKSEFIKNRKEMENKSDKTIVKSIEENEEKKMEENNGRKELRWKGKTKIPQELKIIIMSATLDADAFSKYFGAEVLYVEGRQFPVQIYYTPEPQNDYLDSAMITVLQIHLEHPKGDVLVFLTGREDIENLEQMLEEKQKMFPDGMDSLSVCPIFSGLSPEEQLKAFAPCPPNSRKIILATNIAETSVTINGIKYVVDTGMVKARKYDSAAGMESLKIVPISKAAARQRSGRAGRESSGTCFRLFTEEAFYGLEDGTIPEILRCNLGSVILQMLALGIKDVLNFDYMDKPPRDGIFRAVEQLLGLGALDNKMQLTRPLGKYMAELPLLPELSKVLISSRNFGCSSEILTIVSMLSTEADSVFTSPKGKKKEANEAKKKFVSSDGDHITLLNVYKSFIQAHHSRKWCFDNFINSRAMFKAMDVRNQLKESCKSMKLPLVSCNDKTETIRRCFITGYFSNIAIIQADGTYKTISENKICAIHPSSVLHMRKEPYILFNEIVLTTKQYMRDCMTIEPDWISELAPQFYKKATILNTSAGGK